MKICKVDGCESKHHAKGYCSRHRSQIRRHGKLLERTTKDKNKYVDCGNYYEICLYNRKSEEVARTLIDKDDYEKVKDYKWGINPQGYAVTTIINKKTLRLHHLVKTRHKYLFTDHKDTDKLNNKKNNLRYATDQQNSRNKKSIGICWLKKRNKWKAQIGVSRKVIFLGEFKEEEGAKKARREAELKYFGEFAYKQ